MAINPFPEATLYFMLGCCRKLCKNSEYTPLSHPSFKYQLWRVKLFYDYNHTCRFGLYGLVGLCYHHCKLLHDIQCVQIQLVYIIQWLLRNKNTLGHVKLNECKRSLLNFLLQKRFCQNFSRWRLQMLIRR